MGDWKPSPPRLPLEPRAVPDVFCSFQPTESTQRLDKLGMKTLRTEQMFLEQPPLHTKDTDKLSLRGGWARPGKGQAGSVTGAPSSKLLWNSLITPWTLA